VCVFWVGVGCPPSLSYYWSFLQWILFICAKTVKGGGSGSWSSNFQDNNLYIFWNKNSRLHGLKSPSVCETKNMHTMLICPSYLRDYYWDGHTPPAHYTWPMLGESWPWKPNTILRSGPWVYKLQRSISKTRITKETRLGLTKKKPAPIIYRDRQFPLRMWDLLLEFAGLILLGGHPLPDYFQTTFVLGL